MRRSRWLAVLLAVLLAGPAFVFAKGGGGFSGGSRSSGFSGGSRSGGWSGGSRPSVSMPSVSRTAPSGFSTGTAKPSSGFTSTARPVPTGTLSAKQVAASNGFTAGTRPTGSTPTATTSAFAQRTQARAQEVQSQKAYQAYKAQQAAKAPTKSLTADDYNRYRSDPVARRVTPSDQRNAYREKQALFGSYYTSPPVVVVHSGSTSFGVWDALALSWMFDHQQDQLAAMMYNRPDDPGLRQFKDELAKQAETNAELKAKLAALEGKSSTQAGVRDASYIPPGTPAGALLAPEVLDAVKPALRLCTGRADGNYYYVGNEIAAAAGAINVTVVQTEGSFENLEKLGKDCDAALVQRDSYLVYADEKGLKGELPWQRVWAPYDEYAQLLCSTKSKVMSLADLSGGSKTLFIGDDGSGSLLTWHSWISEIPGYAKVRTVTEGGNVALSKILTGQGDCLLYVSGLGSKFMRDAVSTYGASLMLARIDEPALHDRKDPAGEPLYRFDTIRGDVYPGLRLNTSGCSSFKTAIVHADLVVSNAWRDANQKVYDSAIGDFMSVADTIQRRFDPGIN